jgi:type VI protein secretion system component Hcp
MAVFNFSDRTVIESAGPVWHLVGKVTRDKHQTNRLNLGRPVDALTQKIRSSSGKLLPAVQLSDRLGNSAKLFNVQISPYRPSLHGEAAQHDTSELEQYQFTFQSIEWTWNDGGDSSSDDWPQKK